MSRFQEVRKDVVIDRSRPEQHRRGHHTEYMTTEEGGQRKQVGVECDNGTAQNLRAGDAQKLIDRGGFRAKR